jgi:hypothetical protein
MKKPCKTGHQIKRPRKIGALESNLFCIPLRDAANYFFFLGAAFFFAAFLVAFFIE